LTVVKDWSVNDWRASASLATPSLRKACVVPRHDTSRSTNRLTASESEAD